MREVVNPSLHRSTLRAAVGPSARTKAKPRSQHCKEPGFSSSPEVRSLPQTYVLFSWANFVDVCLLNECRPRYTNCCMLLKQNQFGADDSLHTALPKQSDSLLIFSFFFFFHETSFPDSWNISELYCFQWGLLLFLKCWSMIFSYWPGLLEMQI